MIIQGTKVLIPEVSFSQWGGNRKSMGSEDKGPEHYPTQLLTSFMSLCESLSSPELQFRMEPHLRDGVVILTNEVTRTQHENVYHSLSSKLVRFLLEIADLSFR